MSAALKTAVQFKVQMTVVRGPHAGQVFHFDQPVLTLGRGPENDIVLVNDPQVSRTHARIELNNNEFELTNISGKNILLVHGELVSKSILINDSLFQIGDTEIKFQFDLGQSVVSVPTKPISIPPLQVAKVKPAVQPLVAPEKTEMGYLEEKKGPVALKNIQAPASPTNTVGAGLAGFSPATHAPPNFQRNVSPAGTNNRLRFYLIVALILGGALYFILSPTKSKSNKAKPILKYADEIAVQLNSKPEAELRKKRDEEKKAKESPMVLRAEENLIKGMRDFQLGNYTRAQDFFQVVLNLNPTHALAKRYLQLSRFRFEEIVEAKLKLGESYYQKHNFGMCVSMYQQVLNMLQGKNNDQKFQLAQRMVEKCQLASEGIQ